jgi:hypothetical protein
MSIFKADFSKYTSSRFVAPADEYEVQVTSIKPKTVEIKKGDRIGQKMHMLGFNTKIVQTTNEDKTNADKFIPIDFIINVDQEDGWNRILRFAANCLGIQAGGVDADKFDEEFRERYGNEDWSVDFETNAIGNGWSGLVGSRVIVTTAVGGTVEYPRPDLKGSRPF